MFQQGSCHSTWQISKNENISKIDKNADRPGKPKLKYRECMAKELK